jgi:hypothetical protein
MADGFVVHSPRVLVADVRGEEIKEALGGLFCPSTQSPSGAENLNLFESRGLVKAKAAARG